jgi:hypothetical protein
MVGEGVAVDGTFNDSNPPSGVQVFYFARAVNSANGLFTDSAAQSVQLALDRLHLHAVTKTSGTGNVSGTAVALTDLVPYEVGYQRQEATHKLAGRERPLTVSGLIVSGRLRALAVITSKTTLNLLLEIFRRQRGEQAMLCVRDQFGNRLFGKMARPRIQVFKKKWLVSIEIEQSRHTEGI